MQRVLTVLCLGLGLTMTACSVDDTQTTASQTRDVPTSDVELYIEVLRAALPTDRETDLRVAKCEFNSWAGVGLQGCTCKLTATVGCVTGSNLAMQPVTGEGSAEQMVFTSVCTTASDTAKEALLANARQQGEICVATGGQLIREGAVSYYQ